MTPTRKKILFVGDAACPSGFARATHAYVKALDYRETGGGDYDVTVLGLNYRGDPHPYPYPIYSAAVEGDMFGVGRLIWMCDLVKPDVIIIQNDPWNFPHYLRRLAQFPEYGQHVPVVGIVAVDGKNCGGHFLSGLSLAVFWTKFALGEARRGGYTGPAVVVPLGVDTDAYRPMDKYEARQAVGLPQKCDDAFIVGNVNRNQPRKRLDLTVKYFADWVLDGGKNAYLYLHVAPTGDTGVHVDSLAAYYGISERVVVVEPPVWYGLSEEQMRMTYNCFDVQVSTSQGEGFGLTTFEGMACGVPQIVPDWAALGELCRGAAHLVPCTSTAIGMPYTVNVIGGVADERLFLAALDNLYRDAQVREQIRVDGFSLVSQQRFRWPHIGESVRSAVDVMLRSLEANRTPVEVAG